MSKIIKLALIHEGKVPPDYRVALTPRTARKCLQDHSDLDIRVETSATRCYKDREYEEQGVQVVQSVRDSDILLGVKEVPLNDLLENKTYFFFSHTIKGQEYNRELLKTVLDRKITLIDYETLTDDHGKRLIGFGHYAGLVGAHNALLTYGRKTGAFTVPPAHKCFDYAEMISSYARISLPAIRIAITGGGNVTKGAVEIMQKAGVEEVSPHEFLTYSGSGPCYAVFPMESLYVNERNTFDKKEFYQHPEQYKNNFLPVTKAADILINGIFWKPSIPRLFDTEDVRTGDWAIKVISDITCDPFGSVPINTGASTIANPVYGINRQTLDRTEAFREGPETIDIMAVDNLPNELPRDASQYFSERFAQYILPELYKDQSDILERATIARQGELTDKYKYLQDFVDYKNNKNLTV